MAKGTVTSLAAHRRKKEHEARKAPSTPKERAFMQFFLGSPYIVTDDYTVNYAAYWPSLDQADEK